MPGKSEAIYQILELGVTYAAEKRSDISVPGAWGHLCCSKVKRRRRCKSGRSPLCRRDVVGTQAIYQTLEPGVTYGAEKKSDGGAA